MKNVATDLISSASSLVESRSKGHMAHSMLKFTILKALLVNIHPPKATLIKRFCQRVPGHVGFGQLFRDHSRGFIGGFSTYIGIQSPLYVEILDVILTLEIAKQKGWGNLWIECDSSSTIQAFKNPSLVPWSLQLCLGLSFLGGTRTHFLLGMSNLGTRLAFLIVGFYNFANGFWPSPLICLSFSSSY
ncbi:hypothetical protein HKD37_14G039762 [Glycine soja]